MSSGDHSPADIAREHEVDSAQRPIKHPAPPNKKGPPRKPSPHKPGPGHGKMSDDERKALNIHNKARQEAPQGFGHPRNALEWDDKLASNAQAYAQHLANAGKGLQHSDGDSRPGQGENLYWSKPNGSMADASQGWVNEVKNYSGEKIGEGDFGSYGHYTQVIWPSTTKVGVGMAKDNDGGWFVVGRYSPPGNFTGQSAWTG
ncbi:MAG: hypothetical protein LQ346_004909 [Caloplaca aetnensis]|nr:MAG: hypothetical protein LQ346_004909 [Caloplaca aetnensis]